MCKLLATFAFISIFAFTFFPSGSIAMNYEEAQGMWEKYYAEKKYQRMQEARTIWTNMARAGVTEKSVLAMDFLHFCNSEQGANDLAIQLSDNYQMEVAPAPEEGYWHISGTTRPYGVSLDKEALMSWAEFMSDVAHSHGCVFSTFTIEAPKAEQVFSSESIEAES